MHHVPMAVGVNGGDVAVEVSAGPGVRSATLSAVRDCPHGPPAKLGGATLGDPHSSNETPPLGEPPAPLPYTTTVSVSDAPRTMFSDESVPNIGSACGSVAVREIGRP